ncbi:NAC domain-containing protein 35 [Lactuca sativa]|uniref:NAC domain-containing protein n=1 Tax=Lactuca sativa TaxID=4236 RepID=A0A9R1UEJ2_LACSA|nr:NAC domain-containing protein 35 [Lactuca sativa]KAJ0185658.1 hypothetical protein LSAT_V11C900489370 [Lactuca sativa]
MAIGARTMNQEEEIRNKKQQEDDDDDHENDMVMPGFRFHPTEEELVEFYLRRKVEGKRFNVELITFLDLYRYDPWELPALAAIGEKEWFFYVPRDKKYRNGDRPNRVTTSGYWKATGADRMIRTDNSRSIGLKKTLVFYSGKAPKGIRSSWIMNEYRLPHHETERLQKAEISLCRVYKRSGVEDHPSLPRSLQTRSTSRTSNYHINQQSQNSPSFNCFEGQSSHHTDEKPSDTTSCTPTAIVGTSLGLSNPLNSSYNNVIATPSSTIFPNSVDDLPRIISSQRVLDTCPPSQLLNIHNYHLGDSSNYSPHLFDNMLPQPQQQQQLQPQLSSQALLALNNNLAGAGAGAVHVTFPERIWEWNSMLSEGSKDLTAPFK